MKSSSASPPIPMSPIPISKVAAGNMRLVLAAPPYLAGGKGVQLMFGDYDSPRAQPPVHFPTSSGYEIIDLTSCDHGTRNLSMMSAKADVALVIVDAAFGFEKRDIWAAALASLAQVSCIIFTIDNMALSEWSRERFFDLKDEILNHACCHKCPRAQVIPVDLKSGANVETRITLAPWYEGATVIELLLDVRQQAKGASSSSLDVSSTEPVSDQFAAHICWADDAPMLPGRSYVLKHGSITTPATISTLKYRINPVTLDRQAAKNLTTGDIGYCNISADTAISYRPFEENRDRGNFELHDTITGDLVAYGLIKHGLRRATNIKWQALQVDKNQRALCKKQTPCVLWFTGLSGSGKSSVAAIVEKKLHALGKHTYVLDGDNIRHGLCRDLGFTDEDRVENLRRISELAQLFVDAGLIVLVSFISPFQSERQAAREKFGEGEFLEVFVDTPLEICEARDPKGLYKKARAGQLKNFTGLDSPYEPPVDPEITLSGARHDCETLADMLMSQLCTRRLVDI